MPTLTANAVCALPVLLPCRTLRVAFRRTPRAVFKQYHFTHTHTLALANIHIHGRQEIRFFVLFIESHTMWFSFFLFFRGIPISTRFSRLMFYAVVTSFVFIEKILFAKTRRNSFWRRGQKRRWEDARQTQKRCNPHPCVRVSSSETKPTN